MSVDESAETEWETPQSAERDREPYLATAVICERVIQDAGNQAFSLINLYDRVTFIPSETSPSVSAQTPLVLPVTIFIGFRTRGEYVAKHTVRVVAIGPSGKEYPIGTAEVEFAREKNSAGLSAVFSIAAESLGYYLFDIFLEERFLTRLPLQVTDGSTSTPAPADARSPVPGRG